MLAVPLTKAITWNDFQCHVKSLGFVECDYAQANSFKSYQRTHLIELYIWNTMLRHELILEHV